MQLLNKTSIQKSTIRHAINRCCPTVQNQLGIVSGSVSGGLVNSRLFCRFQRLKVVSSSKRRRSARATSPANFYQLDGTTNYYILMAKGAISGGRSRSLMSIQPNVYVEWRWLFCSLIINGHKWSPCTVWLVDIRHSVPWLWETVMYINLLNEYLFVSISFINYRWWMEFLRNHHASGAILYRTESGETSKRCWENCFE